MTGPPIPLHWEHQGDILAVPGSRPDDSDIGRHADVVVSGGRAFLFYFTHPDRIFNPVEGTIADKRTSLQVAELEWIDGTLVCDRDRVFELELAAPSD